MWCLKRTTWCKKSYKMHYVVQKKDHLAHSHKNVFAGSKVERSETEGRQGKFEGFALQ